MKLSIVILHHNTPHNVTKCLRSIQTSVLPQDYEVVVLDNGGKQSNQVIEASSYVNLPITFEDINNNGFPAGQNYGTSKTTGEYIAVVNPDIVLEENTLALLLQHMDTHKDVGVSTVQLYYPNGDNQDNTRKFPSAVGIIIRKLFNTIEHAEPFKQNETHRPIDWCTGALWVIRRNALETIGGHDERYFMFMSDIELGRHMWSAGFKVHQIKGAQAQHGFERVSGGNILQMLCKKTGRIHMKDAFKYFLYNMFTKHPALSPSGSKR